MASAGEFARRIWLCGDDDRPLLLLQSKVIATNILAPLLGQPTFEPLHDLEFAFKQNTLAYIPAIARKSEQTTADAVINFVAFGVGIVVQKSLNSKDLIAPTVSSFIRELGVGPYPARINAQRSLTQFATNYYISTMPLLVAAIPTTLVLEANRRLKDVIQTVNNTLAMRYYSLSASQLLLKDQLVKLAKNYTTAEMKMLRTALLTPGAQDYYPRDLVAVAKFYFP